MLFTETFSEFYSKVKLSLEDGTFDVASFNAPRGMIYHGGKLYVADSGNHALREIDFKEDFLLL